MYKYSNSQACIAIAGACVRVLAVLLAPNTPKDLSLARALSLSRSRPRSLSLALALSLSALSLSLSTPLRIQANAPKYLSLARARALALSTQMRQDVIKTERFLKIVAVIQVWFDCK